MSISDLSSDVALPILFECHGGVVGIADAVEAIDERPRRQAERQRLLGGHSARGLAYPFAVRLAPARDHILRKGGELRKALLDARPGDHSTRARTSLG